MNDKEKAIISGITVVITMINKNVKVVVRKEYYQFCYEKEKVEKGIHQFLSRVC